MTEKGNLQASFSNVGQISAYIGLTFLLIFQEHNSVVLGGLTCKLLSLQWSFNEILVYEN